jgi:molybdopterin biosynthesis enzyme
MIAYRGRIPILGVPGCARSAKTNIVDLILPALLSEIHISRADITRLGHGGLLGEE